MKMVISHFSMVMGGLMIRRMSRKAQSMASRGDDPRNPPPCTVKTVRQVVLPPQDDESRLRRGVSEGLGGETQHVFPPFSDRLQKWDAWSKKMPSKVKKLTT